MFSASGQRVPGGRNELLKFSSEVLMRYALNFSRQRRSMIELSRLIGLQI